MDPVSPPGRNRGPRVNRQTILSLSDGGSVKKDGYAIAGERRRETPGEMGVYIEILGLFLSPQPIVRRRLADCHGIGPRKSFLKGFVEQPVEPALLLRGRSGSRGLRGFLLVFHGRAPVSETTPCPTLSSGPASFAFERNRAAFQGP
jgi:hypothetical protein